MATLKLGVNISWPWLAGVVTALIFNAGVSYSQFDAIKVEGKKHTELLANVVADQVKMTLDQSKVTNRLDLISERLSQFDQRLSNQDVRLQDHEARIRANEFKVFKR